MSKKAAGVTIVGDSGGITSVPAAARWTFIAPRRRGRSRQSPRIARGDARRRQHAGRTAPPRLGVVLREWGRIGCIGFGGPPAHIALLRELCVDAPRLARATHEFEDAIAACNLLPGPASTQLAIYCAWRVRGRSGALVGGLALHRARASSPSSRWRRCSSPASPPDWVRGAGAGAGAAVAAVAVQAGWSLVPRELAAQAQAACALVVYLARSARVAAATVGPWLVLVLLGCGVDRARACGARGDADRSRCRRCVGDRRRPAACCRSPGSRSRSARSPTAAAS